MAHKDKKNNNGKPKKETKETLLDHKNHRWIKAVLMFTATVIVGLAFLSKAGVAGQWFQTAFNLLFGDSRFTAIAVILSLLTGAFILLRSEEKVKVVLILLAIAFIVIGLSGFASNQNLNSNYKGLFGIVANLSVNLFGMLVANIVFIAIAIIGLGLFVQLWWQSLPGEKEKNLAQEEKKPAFSVNGAKNDESILKIRGVGEKPQIRDPKIIFAGKNKEKTKEKVLVPAALGKYSLPPFDLLSQNETSPAAGNIKENSLIIKKTLENFGIAVEMAEVNVGPTVAQYAFKPAEGVKLSKITTLSNNLALALAAHPIRIEAPIPGKSLVGIEVPNKTRASVGLRTLVSDSGFQNFSAPLCLALGKDVSGLPVYTDLADMPHVLVAGATGSGKTIFLNSIILSFLYKNTPASLRMIMVDPKRVEFQHYNEIPHLLCPVIYDANKTMNALQWLSGEMERRFQIFSEVHSRDIKSYNTNKAVLTAGTQLPYIVLVIDELADLMAAKGRELEAGIVRLSQMARATGIHLVLATQRPSVEVITGLIKANITSRITFQLASQIDSRTVLDTSGAEKLLGLGDMLFLSSKSSKLSRIQTPYISEKEVKKVADWVSQQGKEIKEPQISLVESLKNSLFEGPSGEENFSGDDDLLLEDVKRIVLETRKASASFLQRRLRIGYARAARLIDILEERGIVGPAEGAKPREVYGSVQSAATLPNASFKGDEEEWQKV